MEKKIFTRRLVSYKFSEKQQQKNKKEIKANKIDAKIVKTVWIDAERAEWSSKINVQYKNKFLLQAKTWGKNPWQVSNESGLEGRAFQKF